MDFKHLFGISMWLFFAMAGCTAITDFDLPDATDSETGSESDSDTLGRYSIDGALSGTVTVMLDEDETASLSLELDPALPEASGGDAVLEAMLGDIIELNVVNDETSTSFNLAQGTLVEDTPNESGEYQVILSKDRQTMSVTFTNDFNGSRLSLNGSYTAAFSVNANEQNFVVESFTRDIIISSK